VTLVDTWFLIIAFLWIGYFFLEGFDFGVGMLLPILGKDEVHRRVLINTIGPVWDGNEVWVLTAAGATFAAFPIWYASLFSGFYLPLLIILVALIVRAVAFEFRGKNSKIDGAVWRRRWDWCIMFGSFVPAVLWGVAFSNIIRGVHLDADHEYVGRFVDLLNPYALLGGLTTGGLFLLHGAIFVALKTVGEIRSEAAAIAVKAGVGAVVLAVPFLLWTQFSHGDGGSAALFAVGAVSVVAAIQLIRLRREGWAFVATGLSIVAVFTGMFWALFPNVLPALDPGNSLTAAAAASSEYSLGVMTWVAVIFTPVVLAYEVWTYWIFRKRIGTQHIPTEVLSSH
jgi:cytochrome d ubiquinol oxidase subunit II